jgi:hypothetical protein
MNHRYPLPHKQLNILRGHTGCVLTAKFNSKKEGYRRHYQVFDIM